MLSAEELDSMRADALEMLVETATISRPTLVMDGKGGRKPGSNPVVFANEPARLSIPENALGNVEGREIGEVEIALRAGLDVREGDHVAILGRTYQVTSVIGGQTWEVLRRVRASEEHLP